ncbi:methyltransferase [Bdellovibrio sp. qaytius]|nr:methyltransferase [Bdellovibrio sp. qaytius]
MSSINQYPTFQYSQPNEYHFSHDSVFLAREVYERHTDQLAQSGVQVLDVCAGCGIVGMDLIFHQMKEKSFPGEVDFLEVQQVYHSHFLKNKEIMQGYFPDQPLHFNWQQQNYAQSGEYKKYDLIVSNPPYFIVGKGALSPSEFKNRCRFFIDSDWQSLIQFIKASLKPGGQAYFLVREDLKNAMSAQFAEITYPFQVRGTWVGHIYESKNRD